jgi:hypothetical protein
MADMSSVSIRSLGQQLISAIQNLQRPAFWDAAMNRLRGTVVVESGTIGTVTNVTTVATVTTCSTVTTCGTVSTITNVPTVGNLQSQLMIYSNNLSSWYTGCRSRIS